MSVTFYADGVDLDMNVSNSNAAMLLDVLGLPWDEYGLAGTIEAEDMLGRVLLALAVNPADDGVPVVTEITAGGATFIDCGRRPGYTEARLAELRDIAELAIRNGSTVGWA